MSDRIRDRVMTYTIHINTTYGLDLLLTWISSVHESSSTVSKGLKINEISILFLYIVIYFHYFRMYLYVHLELEFKICCIHMLQQFYAGQNQRQSNDIHYTYKHYI
jgi:hypothetical protein